MKFSIRKIQPEDNKAVASIIRTVMPEFGANREGFAIHDPEVDDMHGSFSQPRSAYFVCLIENIVVGGAGVAPLAGGDKDTCELKKMYFLPAARGKGFGQQVLNQCVSAAKSIGFEYCYLETFNTMNEAMRLYEKTGFEKIAGPMGNTGHFACDIFYLLDLKK
jgi:putative acetyltransferase